MKRRRSRAGTAALPAAVLALGCFCTGGRAEAQPSTPVAFQPGLWEIVGNSNAPNGRSQSKVTSRICYRVEDAPTPAKWLPPQRGLGMKCRESDVRTSGAEVTWKLTCDGDYQYAGTGRLVLSRGSYRAGVQMSPRPGSKGAKLEQVIEARRVSDCS